MKKIITLIIFILIIFANFFCVKSNNEIINSYEQYNIRKEEARKLRESVGFVTNSSNDDSYTPDNRRVYITSNSAKFHSPGCDEMKSTPHTITVAQAYAKGYAPCKICNPYNLAHTSQNDNFIIVPIIIVIVVFLVVLIICIFLKNKKNKKNK